MTEVSPEIVKGLFGLGGTIVGAVIGAVFKGWYDAKNRDSREIIALVRGPSPLILMSKQMAPRIQLTVDGKAVPSIASCDLDILNTGNKAVDNIEVSIAVSEGEIVSLEARKLYKDSIDTDTIDINQETAVVKVPFLNCGENINLRILLTSTQCNVTPKFNRLRDVVFTVRQTDNMSLDNPVTAGFFAVIRSNWLMHHYFLKVYPPYRRYIEADSQINNRN